MCQSSSSLLSQPQTCRRHLALRQAPPCLHDLGNMADISEKQLDIAACRAQVGAKRGCAPMPDIRQAECAVPTTRLAQPRVIDVGLDLSAFRAHALRQCALEHWLRQIESLSRVSDLCIKFDTAGWAEACVSRDIGITDMALHGQAP